MSVIHCPSCQAAIRFEAVDGPATPAASGALGRRELRAAYEVMKTLGPGRRPFSEIWEAYEDLRDTSDSFAEMTKVGLAKALGRNGATPWRRANVRGWEIPAVGDKPARPTEGVLEREDNADYRETVVQYATGAARRQPEFVDDAPKKEPDYSFLGL